MLHTGSHVLANTGGYYAPNISILVLACKSDLDGAIDPQKAIEVLLRYDVGLVEVSNTHEGKEKMRRSFDWLLKAIFRERGSYFGSIGHFFLTCLQQSLLTANLDHIEIPRLPTF
jgi:hypothetical protein